MIIKLFETTTQAMRRCNGNMAHDKNELMQSAVLPALEAVCSRNQRVIQY